MNGQNISSNQTLQELTDCDYDFSDAKRKKMETKYNRLSLTLNTNDYKRWSIEE